VSCNAIHHTSFGIPKGKSFGVQYVSGTFTPKDKLLVEHDAQKNKAKLEKIVKESYTLPSLELKLVAYARELSRVGR